MKTSSSKNNLAYIVMPNNISTSSETCFSPIFRLTMDPDNAISQ